jgi:hypothetical protein
LALHGALAGGLAGHTPRAPDRQPSERVEVDVRLDALASLGRAPAEPLADAREERPPSHHRSRPRTRPRAPAPPAPPEEVAPAAATLPVAKPADGLDQLGVEGGQLSVLLRLDRLAATPFARGVSALLPLLPGVQDLGPIALDELPAVLVCTPGPLDASVTLVVARHRLDEQAMRTAAGRSARGARGAIAWREEAGRPYGEGGDRLFALPAPGVVLVGPLAYRDVLLATARSPQRGWAALPALIDARDELLPETGFGVATAIDVARVVSRPAGLPDALVLPRSVTVMLGATPAPWVDVDASFINELEAQAWETDWPALQRAAEASPDLARIGFAPLASRATLARRGAVLHLHDAVTMDEAFELLRLARRALAADD